MSEIKLKPCPFCGSEAIYTVCKMYALAESEYIEFNAWCECNTCNAKGFEIEASYASMDLINPDALSEMYESAKQAWNERAYEEN